MRIVQWQVRKSPRMVVAGTIEEIWAAMGTIILLHLESPPTHCNHVRWITGELYDTL